MARFRGSSQGSQAEAQRVKGAAEFLDRFVAASNQEWASHASEQTIVGSPYEAACRVTGGRWAFDFARFHLAGAEDHLMTVAVILGSGWLPTYSWYALVRSCLEASARACWLLDPHLSPPSTPVARLHRASGQAARRPEVRPATNAAVDPQEDPGYSWRGIPPHGVLRRGTRRGESEPFQIRSEHHARSEEYSRTGAKRGASSSLIEPNAGSERGHGYLERH